MPIELGAAQAENILAKIIRKSKRRSVDIGAISWFMD